MSHSEADLVARAKTGDRSAFDELFESTRDSLLRVIRSRMGAALGQRVDPEDVLQETLLRAYRSIAQFEWQGPESFTRWVEGVARHALVDAARSSGRRQELQIIREPKAEGVSPSKHLRRGERFERLESCIHALKPDYREVLLLARIEGLTIKEISARLERSENAVRNLLFRAMQELKKSFSDTGSLHLGPRAFGEPHRDDTEMNDGSEPDEC